MYMFIYRGTKLLHGELSKHTGMYIQGQQWNTLNCLGFGSLPPSLCVYIYLLLWKSDWREVQCPHIHYTGLWTASGLGLWRKWLYKEICREREEQWRNLQSIQLGGLRCPSVLNCNSEVCNLLMLMLSYGKQRSTCVYIVCHCMLSLLYTYLWEEFVLPSLWVTLLLHSNHPVVKGACTCMYM